MTIQFLKNLDNIEPYVGGMPIEELSRKIGIPEDKIIKLASNENPYGISPVVKKALAKFNEYELYPDGSGYNLIHKISEHFELETSQIVIGNGSNDILELAARIVLDQDSEVIFSEHAFAVYGLVTKATGAREVTVPAIDYAHDLDGFLKKITSKTKLIFVANPNNPTGTLIDKILLLNFLEKVPDHILVVLDEAYEEYLDENQRSDSFKWLNKFKNLLISRSFSKAYGLASLRVGFGTASKEIIAKINQIRQPFNVNSIAQMAALLSLSDIEFVKEGARKNREQKKYLENSFDDLGIEYIKSYGNFISFSLKSDENALACYDYLLNKGIILRPIANYGMPEFLRVSIGTEDENKIFINCLTEFMGKIK